ncbi:hypothetical protein DITRI_Ditri12bG0014400 [Diplodiscus trichospermus]
MKCFNGDMSLEKLKNLITGVIRLNKFKSLMLPRSPVFDQIKLWVLGITTMMLLLWVFALRLAALGDTIGPMAVKFELPRLIFHHHLSSMLVLYVIRWLI